MDPFDPLTSGHPVVGLLERVEDALDQAVGAPVFGLDTATTADVVRRLAVLESKVVAVKLTALAHAGVVDVAGTTGASSTGTWLAHATRTTRREAFTQTRLAGSLDHERHPVVRDALAAGRVRVEQAQVIVRAVDALPDDLEPGLVEKAEGHLVEQAGLFDAAKLKVLGDRLLDVVAPDLADAYEARRLEAEEKRAAETTRLTMSEDGHGSVFVKAKLPQLYAAMLKKLLLAYAAPKHQAAVASAAGVPTPERRPSPERMGRAFCDLLESLTDTHAPATGGTGATVVVTMDWATLTGGLGPPTWTPVSRSHRARPAGWRVRPGSSPPSSAADRSPWTWAGGPGSTPGPSGSRSRSVTAAAPPTAATGHPGCARSTTTHPGRPAASPTSTTPGCSAPTTTPEPTTPPTPPANSPTAKSPSTDGREPRADTVAPGCKPTHAVARWANSRSRSAGSGSIERPRSRS